MNTPLATTRRVSLPKGKRRRLRVAMLAPPWIPVPPPRYGGIEAVVACLCEQLVARGHDVTLFAAAGSRSAARVHAPLGRTRTYRMGGSLVEADHVGAAYDVIDRAARDGEPFDVVHDHSGFTAVATANRLSVPVVHTLHGPFTEQSRPFYERHGHKVRLVALSRYQLEHAPPGVRVAELVPNPIPAQQWPHRDSKDEYVLWMGRMDPVKGAHRAIAAARRAGRRLLLAGPVQPGQEDYFAREIQPHLDGERVRFLGEVGGSQQKELIARARALLMPIRWPEPFGMVMVEALSCGTPVLAFPEGAAREIVIHGRNGFHVRDEREMAGAIDSLHTIDPMRCRISVTERYEAAIVTDAYEAVYARAARARQPREMRFARSGMSRSGLVSAPQAVRVPAHNAPQV